MTKPLTAAAAGDPSGSGIDLVEPVLFEPPPPRRRFSPGDGLRLLLGLALLLMGLLFATVGEETIGGAEADLVEGLSSISDRVEQAIIGGAQVVALLAPLAFLAVIVWYRRWGLLVTLVVSSNVASIALVVVERAIGERESSVVLEEQGISSAWLGDPSFPTSSYIAGVAALITVGGPWLTRRWKRATWGWLAILVVLRILGSGEPVLDLGLAVAIGIVVGSLALLVFGSPNPEPRPLELLAGLRAAGFAPAEVGRAGTDDAPYFVVHETTGVKSFVKVRTPDDRNADFLNRIYRAVRLRSEEFERPFSTLKRRVEHEALLLTRASTAGSRVPELRAVGTTEGGSAFVVTERAGGVPATTLEAADLTDAILDDVWNQVGALHDARIAHRHLALDNVLVELTTGHAWLVDLDEGELAATDRDRARDVAELLVDLALVVGEQRAVTSAVDRRGADAVAAALPHLQPLALPGPVRRRLRRDKGLLDRLRTEVMAATGAAEVPLESLERIKPRTLVMIVAGSLAFYSLLPQIASFGDTADAFGDARLEWLPAILVASFATYVAATVSFMGSVAYPVPVGGSFRLNVAASFASLVGPSTTGTMALTVRFLRRAGIDTTAASASVALNAIAGVVTHLALLACFVAWTGSAGVGGFSFPETNTVLLVVAIMVAVVAVAMVVGPIRRRLLRPALDVLRRAGGYVASVFRSPVRVVALLGGSSLITLTYVAALIFSVEAFGGGISAPQIGAAYLVAAAIANVAPTPGGLGALEATMIAALTGFGLDDAVAVSSVLTFRLATFWLPILPGWAVFAWMQRNGEV